jgi:hypothetical protein
LGSGAKLTIKLYRTDLYENTRTPMYSDYLLIAFTLTSGLLLYAFFFSLEVMNSTIGNCAFGLQRTEKGGGINWGIYRGKLTWGNVGILTSSQN